LENLLLPVICIDKLKKVEILIYEFVEKLSREEDPLYPKSIMLSDVHELLHLVDCTIAFGTLNLINCFPFEELNRKLMNFSHGFDLIGEEIFKILYTSKFLLNYAVIINNIQIKKFITTNLDLKSSNRKRLNKDQDIQILSKCEETTKMNI
jgi:hypothetical protein